MKSIKYLIVGILTMLAIASSHALSTHYLNYDGWYFAGISAPISIYGVKDYKTSLDVPSSVIDPGYVNSYTSVGKLSEKIFAKQGRYWSNISSATTASIPSCVTSIGNSIFLDNTVIKSVTVRASVDIPTSMFQGCTALTTVTWAGGTIVGTSAFQGCTSLKSMAFLPSTIKTYNSYAFKGTGLTEFSFGKNTISIGASAFEDVTTPEFLSLPNSVTTLSSSCFAGCNGLTLANLGDGNISISSNAFANCKKLKYLIFGKNTKSISANAFAGCNNIKEIYINSTTPPSCALGAFTSDAKSKATLYVPAGSYAAYWSSTEWEDFVIVEKAFEPITSIFIQSEFELVKDTRVRLPYTIAPEGASIPSLNFVCSNTSIAEVSSDGFITGKKSGNAKVTIYAQDGSGVSGSCNITVKEPEITLFTVTLKSLILNVNENANLSVSIKPDNTNKSVKWTSSDTEIAVVKERDGVAIVLARAVGECVITAKSDEYPDIFDTCSVVVVEDSILRGDVNEDGYVDEEDLSTLILMLLNKIPTTAPADINRDGNINGLDFVILSKKLGVE